MRGSLIATDAWAENPAFAVLDHVGMKRKTRLLQKNVEIPTDFEPFEFLLNLKFLYKGVFPFAQENFFYVRQDLKFSNLDTWTA